MSERPRDERRKQSATRTLKGFEGLDRALMEQNSNGSAPIDQPRHDEQVTSADPLSPEHAPVLVPTVEISVPKEGFTFTGTLEKGEVRKKMFPLIQEALVKSGMDPQKAKTLLERSLLGVFSEEDPAKRNELFNTRLKNLWITAQKDNKPKAVEENKAEKKSVPQINNDAPSTSTPEESSSVGGGGKSGGGSGDEGGPEKEHSFEFHPEMLKTVTGRKKVFREMVHMFNEVRKKRDALGFGEERDAATGKVLRKASRSVTNDDFDGFRPFRTEYFKLRKLLEEYSERGIVRDQEGKVEGSPIETPLSEEEGAEFARKFSFLTQYYGRTERFSESDPAGELHPKTELPPNQKRPRALEIEPVPAAAPQAQAEPVEPIVPQNKNETAEKNDGSPYEWGGQANGEHSYNYEAEDLLKKHIELEKEETQKAPEKSASSPYEWKAGVNQDATFNYEAEDLLTKQAGLETVPPQKEGPKAWEQRAELRRDMHAKHEAFRSEYEAYMSRLASEHAGRGVLRKLQFWKKDEQPSELKAKEEAYLEASSAYAGLLQSAMEKSKFVETKLEKEKPEHGLKTWLAHEFVVKPAHEKLSMERKFVPEGAASRNLKSIQEIFKKHGKTISRASFAASLGFGVMTGGLGAALAVLVGKANAAAFIGGGSLAGAAIFGEAGRQLVKSSEGKRDAMLVSAFTGYNAGNIRALRQLYEENSRAVEKAIKLQRVLAASGAIAGGLAGAAISGSFDADAINIPEEPLTPKDPVTPEDPETPDTPDEPVTPEEPVPPVEPEVPLEPEVPEEPDDPVLPDEPYTPIGPEEPEEPIDDPEPYVPEVLVTFEEGSKVDTVSEALFETWKDDPSYVEGDMTKAEFLANMYSAIAEIEKDPALNASLMEEMGITSGDIDKVQVGQTINLQPFFEYLNERG